MVIVLNWINKCKVLNKKRLISKGCNLIIDQPNGKCVKRTCDALKNQANSFYKNFEISISVSDHASTMNDIRSSAKPFEKFLGLQVKFLFLKPWI